MFEDVLKLKSDSTIIHYVRSPKKSFIIKKRHTVEMELCEDSQYQKSTTHAFYCSHL